MSDERKEMKRQDQELITQFLGGDESAFETLVKKYRDRTIKIAFRVVHNEEEAIDVSQEAFIRVHKSLNKFSGKSSFYTWLYRIVTNLAIDHQRKSKRMAEFRDELSNDNDETDSDLVARETDPRNRASDQELQKQILKEIEALPEHHRMVIVLRDLEDFSYNEIAEIMNCSLGTVMSRLHYAREKLQKRLEKYL